MWWFGHESGGSRSGSASFSAKHRLRFRIDLGPGKTICLSGASPHQRFVPGAGGDRNADGVALVPNVLKIWAGTRAAKYGKIVSDPLEHESYQ